MDGMEKLRRGVSSKIANARSHSINSLRQFKRRLRLLPSQAFSVMPVLTEKTVESATVIENSQVFISIFRALGIGVMRETCTSPARTDPICNTIRRQGIIIPGKKSFLWRRIEFFPLAVLPNSTVPYCTLSNLALVETIIA